MHIILELYDIILFVGPQIMKRGGIEFWYPKLN